MITIGIFEAKASLGQLAQSAAEAALNALVGTFAVAPRWWNVEVLNVLLTLERRKRLVAGKAIDLLRHMQRLQVHLQDSRASVFELHALSIRQQLTSYDALYLEVALATGLPLATRDKALRQAATESGVGVWFG